MDWQILSHTETGASHLRHGKPNQDAIAFSRTDAGTLLAVADGHGSARYRHSDIGARLAVECALSVLQNFAADFEQDDPETVSENLAHLPGELADSWRQAVEAIDSEAAADGHVAYGTTLLAVLLTARYALYVQIGDGDLLVLDAGGNLQRPLPKDAAMIGNETYSLCQAQAENLFQIAVRFFEEVPPPKLVFLASDGYANSFVNEADFRQAVYDFYSLLDEHGAEKIQACLPAWLQETSQQGCGDDVTLGILLRTMPAA